MQNDNEAEVRKADIHSYIDMGFLNRRLAISALGPARDFYLQNQKPGNDHMTTLVNDHLLVHTLIQVCQQYKAPTLAEALNNTAQTQTFMSIERLESCPEIYDSARVSHEVKLEFPPEKPVVMSYHTQHIVSDDLAPFYDPVLSSL